jgi:hypothetical protein
MTKTTNYEISKKLAEIGFSRQPFWVWTSKDCCCPYETHLDGFRAYDLETLLDVLPDTIGGCLMIHKEGMYYQESMVEVAKLENESLADTAGRMIIELYNNNLINF